MRVRSAETSEITDTTVATLRAQVRRLAQEYEHEVSQVVFSFGDTSLSSFTQAEPPDTSSPQLAYYQILKDLHDHLKTIRYPDKQAALNLKKLLIAELTRMKEAEWEKESTSDVEGDIDAALFNLFKATHIMRKRDDIDLNYLQDLVSEIQDETKLYHASTNHRLHATEAAALKELANITLQADATDSIFSQYHSVLSKLNKATEKLSKKNIPYINNLRQLLIHELQTQHEAKWPARHAETNEAHAIGRALDLINEHTSYSSQHDEDYATKWQLSATEFNNKELLKPWVALCEQQGWHIEADHDKEIGIATRRLLGLQPENCEYLHNDCYVLQNDDVQIESLENEIHQLNNIMRIQGEIEELERKINAETRIHSLDEGKNPNQIRLDRKRKLLAEQKKDILDPEELLATKSTELAEYKIKIAKEEIDKLQENLLKLKLWSVRNLSILFAEHIIDGQITRLEKDEIAALDDLTQNFEKMLNHLTAAFKNILIAINNVHEKIHDEFHEIRSLFAANHVHIHLPHLILQVIDVDYQTQKFRDYLENHLSEYTDAKHFREVKNHIYYTSLGIELPDVRSIKQICADTNYSRPVALPKEPIVRTRVIQHPAPLEVATAPVTRYSTAYQMLFGMVIGLMFAMMLAGIVAAIVLTGGLSLLPLAAGAAIGYAAAIGTGGLIGLFGGIGLAGVAFGLLGGWLHSRQQSTAPSAEKSAVPHTLSSTAHTQATLAANPPTDTTSPLAINGEQSVEMQTLNSSESAEPTAQYVAASPGDQNQQTQSALTRNEFRR